MARMGLTVPRLCLVIGAEGCGASSDFSVAANRKIHLPMNGFVESFNVAVATAMFIYALKEMTWEEPGTLSSEEQGALREKWRK